MCLDDELRCCGLEAHASLDADDGVAHVGIAADGIRGTNLLNALYGADAVVEVLAVHTHYLTLLERYLQQRVLLGGDVLQVGLLGQALRGVEKLAAADAGAPDAHVVRVLQLGEVGREAVVVQVVHLLLARQLLVARQGDDLHARCHDEEGHVKAYLVVAGTGAAVGYGVGAYLAGIAGDGQSLEDALAADGDGVAVVA